MRNEEWYIVRNEEWYGDGSPQLGERFTGRAARQDRDIFVQILRRAVNRVARFQPKLGIEYQHLADKLEFCSSRGRCGSLACPSCAGISESQGRRPEPSDPPRVTNG